MKYPVLAVSPLVSGNVLITVYDDREDKITWPNEERYPFEAALEAVLAALAAARPAGLITIAPAAVRVIFDHLDTQLSHLLTKQDG